MALSRFGLTPKQYMELTPLEFYEAIKDDDDLRKYPVRILADAIRMSTLWLVNIQLPKNKKVRGVTKLWEYPWDKKKHLRGQTVEEMKQMLKLIARDTKGNTKRGRRGLPSPGYSAHKHRR